MRQRLLCILVTGIAAAPLLWSGIKTADAAGGGQAPGAGDRYAVRPTGMQAPTTSADQPDQEGGDLITIFEDAPWPEGVLGYIIFSAAENGDRTANDVVFNDATPIVGVSVYYDSETFPTDPDNPGSDFTLYIWADDGTGEMPSSPPIGSELEAFGPHQNGDGVLNVELAETGLGGADSILAARFNFGNEFFVFDPGVKYWIGMASDGPGTLRSGVAQSNTPFSSFSPAVQAFGTGSAWAVIDVNDPPVTIDIGFTLHAFAPVGGTTVVSLVGTTAGTNCGTNPGNCCIRITPTTAPINTCNGGACPNDLLFGPNCFGQAALPPGVSADFAAAALAGSFTGCNAGVITISAVGPRVIITTNQGTKPKACLSINGSPIGLIGGQNQCNPAGCGMTYQVGPTQTLPEIELGNDRFTTVSGDCGLDANNPAGTWLSLNLPGSLFDRPGLPAAQAVNNARFRLDGVARNFATDDSDTLVRRTEDIIFGRCSGDFSRPGGAAGVFSPDGVADATDLAQFNANCFGQVENPGTMQFPTPDCAFFDYDGNDTINNADRLVLNCLIAAGNTSECCPNNTDLPQRASFRVATELTRLHLRSCNYLPVTRTGISCPENWVVDVYQSAADPQIGANDVGVCEAGDTQGANGNDVILNAQNLGLVAEGSPRRTGGRIGNTQVCDIAPFYPGDHDADVYRFSVAFRTTVNINIDAQDTAPQCAGVSPAANASLWLYNSRGLRVASNDPAGANDPSLSRIVDAGVYYVLVAGGGQTTEPFPNGRPGSPNCSIASAPEIDAGATDPTGFYDLRIAAIPGSNLVVTQTTASSGTYTARTLVQPLITYQKVCDPYQAVLIDTGGTGTDAFSLASTGPWTKTLLPGSQIDPGDPNFIPGVDGAGNAPNLQLVETNGAGFAQRVRATTDRVCASVFDQCAYVQEPDPAQTLAAINALHTSAANFPVADDFTLAAATTINSVTFWVTPAGTVTPDHTFEVEIRGTFIPPQGVCTIGVPGGVLNTGTTGDPFILPTALGDMDQVTVNLAAPFNAAAGTRYWVVLRLNTTSSPSGANVRFVTSLDGDEIFMHDVISAAGQASDPATDCLTEDGNGWDCAASTDTMGTMCNEANPDGDQRLDGNLAFCVGTGSASGFTKDLPADVACGSWRSAAGRIIWSQPFVLRADGTVGFFSDFSLGTMGGNQAADSFTIYENSTITGVVWRGAYTSNAPVFTEDEFRLEFWDDGNTVPSALQSVYNPTNAQIERVGGSLAGDPGRQVFSYSYQLAPTLAVSANQVLWFSVINNTVGQAYNWTFATAAGGNSDGKAALRAGLANNPPWQVLPSAGDPPTDFSFDILVAGNTRVIAGDSISCTVGDHSRLGYRFDPHVCTINGFQAKAPEGNPNESTGNRWRNVAAPWKYYDELAAAGAPAGQLATLLGQLSHPQSVTPEEIACLTQGVSGTIASVFGGLAAYDADPSINGVGVGGALHRLCNGGLIEDVDPTAALSGQLNVKGACWTNGTTTFVTGTDDTPNPPVILHQTGQDGQTQPCSGYIDPRRESTTTPPSFNAGMLSARLRFNQPVFRCDNGMSLEGALTAFTMTQTGPAIPPPTVTGVTRVGGDDSYIQVSWNRPLTLRQWTTLIASGVCNASGDPVVNMGNLGLVNEPDRTDYGFLPANCDQNNIVNPLDLLRYKQILNGLFVPPCNTVPFFLDTDRNLLVNPLDLLAFKRLINGIAPSTQSWTNATMLSPRP